MISLFPTPGLFVSRKRMSKTFPAKQINRGIEWGWLAAVFCSSCHCGVYASSSYAYSFIYSFGTEIRFLSTISTVSPTHEYWACERVFANFFHSLHTVFIHLYDNQHVSGKQIAMSKLNWLFLSRVRTPVDGKTFAIHYGCTFTFIQTGSAYFCLIRLLHSMFNAKSVSSLSLLNFYARCINLPILTQFIQLICLSRAFWALEISDGAIFCKVNAKEQTITIDFIRYKLDWRANNRPSRNRMWRMAKFIRDFAYSMKHFQTFQIISVAKLFQSFGNGINTHTHTHKQNSEWKILVWSQITM